MSFCVTVGGISVTRQKKLVKLEQVNRLGSPFPHIQLDVILVVMNPISNLPAQVHQLMQQLDFMLHPVRYFNSGSAHSEKSFVFYTSDTGSSPPTFSK